MRKAFTFLAAAAIAVACTGVPGPSRATAPADPEPGPQLITEEFLRRQLDLHTIQTLAEPIAQLLFDSHVVVHGSGLLATWDRDPVGYIHYGPHWQDVPYTAHVRFGDPTYRPDGGTVNEHDCQQLPGAGTKTTGEFTSVDNRIEGVIEHKISKSVTESRTVTNSLTQTLELESGQTFEAGAGFGGAETKETISFTEKFGLSTESIASSTAETQNTVEDVAEVPSMATYYFAFTTNNGQVSCKLTIDATGDWAMLEIIPPRDRPYHGNTWCTKAPIQPNSLSAEYAGRGANGDVLLRSDAVDQHKCTIGFDEADGINRLFAGTDVRCPYCHNISVNAVAQRALAQFGSPDAKHISFDGRRLSGSKKDSSYKALNVTGYDTDCVEDILNDAGTAVTDDLLDRCAP